MWGADGIVELHDQGGKNGGMSNFSQPGAVDLSGLAKEGAAEAGTFVRELTEADFEQVAAKSMQHPVILEFYSTKDPAGESLSRDLAQQINAAQGRFLLGRIDVDAQPRISSALGIQAVPTVVALLSGQLAPLFQGTKSSQEIEAVLQQVAQAAVANGMTGRAEPVGQGVSAEQPAQADARFSAADSALDNGDYAQAIVEFEKILAENPGDVEALAGRAQAALLNRSLAFVPEQIVAQANDDRLEAQLAAADLEVIQGQGEAALDRLLNFASEASEEDREIVRLRLLELFEVLGRTDPVVLKARRKLATVLF